MQIIKINPKNPSLKAIKFAAKIINQGGIVVYPTDTIYGIGASALDKKAIEKIYKIKKRPRNKPLSIIIRDIKMAERYCAIDRSRSEIFKAVFSGPFTLIFKARLTGKKSDLNLKHQHQYDSLDYHTVVKTKELFKNVNCKSIFTVYKNTLSVRIPDFKITKLLSKELEIPFTSTSANISGMPGSGDINKVLKQFGINKKKPNLSVNRRIDLVLDAGVLPKKNPSIIIDLTGKDPKIVRKF